jgi:hypothetical protein
VSGPQAGNSGNREPDTHSHRLPGTPSSSPETCTRALVGTLSSFPVFRARTRYVSRWFVSVYLPCERNTTQHLSSCLVTRTGNVPDFPGRFSDRGL